MLLERPLRILLIQFRLSEAAAKLEKASIGRELGSEVEVSTISALDLADTYQSNMLVDQFDGVIFGGSGDFDFDGDRAADDMVRYRSAQFVDDLSPLLTYLRDYSIPTLGICFGHQLIGAFHGVPVHHDSEQKKMRTHEVSLTNEGSRYDICADLPNSFAAQYGHKDVLSRVPDDAALIMSGGDSCRVSALAYSPTFITTQFHPELTVADMQKRVELIPNYLPEGMMIDELFVDSPEAHKVLKNFGKLAHERWL